MGGLCEEMTPELPIVITLEGGIGVGKTSVLNELKKRFPKIRQIQEPAVTLPVSE